MQRRRESKQYRRKLSIPSCRVRIIIFHTECCLNLLSIIISLFISFPIFQNIIRSFSPDRNEIAINTPVMNLTRWIAPPFSYLTSLRSFGRCQLPSILFRFIFILPLIICTSQTLFNSK